MAAKSTKGSGEKDPAAVSLGRRGGLKGGKVRMAAMTRDERRELARKAGKASAEARWKGKRNPIG
jgi:hypothetical protein